MVMQILESDDDNNSSKKYYVNCQELLNKSNKTGAFSIDESYTIKVLVDKLAVALKQNK